MHHCFSLTMTEMKLKEILSIIFNYRISQVDSTCIQKCLSLYQFFLYLIISNLFCILLYSSEFFGNIFIYKIYILFTPWFFQAFFVVCFLYMFLYIYFCDSSFLFQPTQKNKRGKETRIATHRHTAKGLQQIDEAFYHQSDDNYL